MISIPSSVSFARTRTLASLDSVAFSPVTAIRERLSLTPMKSGFSVLRISSKRSSLQLSSSSLRITTVMESMPVRQYSKGRERSFSISNISALKPDPSLTITFSIWTTDMPFLPETPVTGFFATPWGRWRTMVVPISSGLLVLRILMGISISDAESTASEWSTEAPI